MSQRELSSAFSWLISVALVFGVYSGERDHRTRGDLSGLAHVGKRGWRTWSIRKPLLTLAGWRGQGSGQAGVGGVLEKEGPDAIIFSEANAFPSVGNRTGLLL